MSNHTPSEFATRLQRGTETYLDWISGCVSLLEDLLGRYKAERPIDLTVNRIDRLESECDRLGRELSALVTTTDEVDLQHLRIHHNAQRIVTIYQRLDTIASRTERIATEFRTIAPALSTAYFESFSDLAEWTTTAMEALETAVVEFVDLLCGSADSGSIVEEVQTVRMAEGACDELRDQITAEAFADPAVDRPLVYREFASLFSGLSDTMEDVTDELVVLSGRASWIETERDIDPTVSVLPRE